MGRFPRGRGRGEPRRGIAPESLAWGGGEVPPPPLRVRSEGELRVSSRGGGGGGPRAWSGNEGPEYPRRGITPESLAWSRYGV